MLQKVSAWFGWLLGKAAEAPTKAVSGVIKDATGAGKDLTGIAKDVTGIQRDRVEIQLAEKKLEEGERSIQPATFEDVKRYDKKVATLIKTLVWVAIAGGSLTLLSKWITVKQG